MTLLEAKPQSQYHVVGGGGAETRRQALCFSHYTPPIGFTSSFLKRPYSSPNLQELRAPMKIGLYHPKSVKAFFPIVCPICAFPILAPR